MVKPRDESARARFASELDRNFSVVASAGSGKTTAITQRVLSIARSPNAAEILPRLVVVTFTNRAADEMQQRARQILLQENLKPEVQTAFNRAFFGTIHSFCMKLLTDFGHYLGLPAPLELVSNDNDLWQEFVQRQTRIGHSLGEKNRAALLRLVQARDLLELDGALARRSCAFRNYRHARRSISRKFTRELISAVATTSASHKRNCASGKNVTLAIGNICAGRFVSPQGTRILRIFGRRRSRHCANGSAPLRRAWRRKYSAIFSIFDSSADSSRTEIKSRWRKNCCDIRSQHRAFAKKRCASFSMRRRTPNRRNFPCCSKRRDRWPRPVIGWRRASIRRRPDTSAWTAIFSNRFIGSART